VKYLLDTDHASFLQRRSGPKYVAMATRMAANLPADFGLSIVSFHEQVIGAHTVILRARTTTEVSRRYKLLGEILRGFQIAPVLTFDSAAGAALDRLRAQRARVSTMDLRIGAIAVSRGLILLTRNTSDFSQIPGLVIEDWTR
jgi:tRNA(fMet)-specific endonuclease VapC